MRSRPSGHFTLTAGYGREDSLKDKKDVHHGRLTPGSDAGVRSGCWGLQAGASSKLCESEPLRFAVSLHGRAQEYLSWSFRQGFLPNPGHGFVIGTSKPPRNIVAEMSRRRRNSAAIVSSDPAVADVALDRRLNRQSDENNGRMFKSLKPMDARNVSAHIRFIRRLGPKLATVQGAALLLPHGQDINVGGRTNPTSPSTHCQDANLDELDQWGRRSYEN